MENELFAVNEEVSEKHSRAYLPSSFIVSALPTRPVKKIPFVRQYNNFTLTLAGVGQVPNGKYGRLLLTILTTHAVLSKNSGEDKVWIRYKSMGELLKELQLPKTRGKEIKEQLGYFAKATFIFEERITVETRKTVFKDLLGEELDLGEQIRATKVSTGIIPFLSNLNYIDLEDNKAKKETVVLSLCLSSEFTKYSREHSVPIDYTIYKNISSPTGKDIYAWLMYRMNSVTETVFIPAHSLVEQFMPVKEGSARNQEWNNYDYIKNQISEIKTKYCTELNIEFSSNNDGIYLHKSNLPKLTDGSHYVLVTSDL